MFSGGSDDPFAQMHRQMQERHSHMMQHLGGMMQDPFFGDFGSHHVRFKLIINHAHIVSVPQRSHGVRHTSFSYSTCVP
jgi:hypothetical protein